MADQAPAFRRGEIDNGLGVIYHQAGDIALARKYFERALTTFESIAPERMAAASILINLAAVLRDEGSRALALDHLRGALDTASTTGLTDLLHFIHVNMAAIHLELGQAEECQAEDGAAPWGLDCRCAPTHRCGTA